MSRALVFAIILAASAQPANAQKALPFSLEGKVDFNGVLIQAGIAVEWLLSRLSDRSKFLPALSQQLSTLAGKEEALALSLETFAQDPSGYRFDRPGGEARLDQLNDQIADVEQSIFNLRAAITKVDSRWAMNNPDLTADIGAFSHDGIITYVTPSGQSHQLDRAAGLALAIGLRKEALGVRALAQRIKKSEKPK